MHLYIRFDGDMNICTAKHRNKTWSLQTSSEVSEASSTIYQLSTHIDLLFPQRSSTAPSSQSSFEHKHPQVIQDGPVPNNKHQHYRLDPRMSFFGRRIEKKNSAEQNVNHILQCWHAPSVDVFISYHGPQSLLQTCITLYRMSLMASTSPLSLPL